MSKINYQLGLLDQKKTKFIKMKARSALKKSKNNKSHLNTNKSSS